MSDDKWNAGQAKAAAEGTNLTEVLRQLLDGYLTGHRIEFQATSKATVNGEQQVVRGLAGNLDEIRRVYRPSQWTIEEYDISPPRPVKRKSS
ncbi:hypothetical protein [Mycolicibacterium conceptionense]|uniref:hypothetical protein n=1 Tax=Mycolicibacterium conceptionense TaxID=451644 RepID=UPI003204AAC1